MPISPQDLASIWQECAAGLGLLARTRCSNPEDCVQEAFLRLAKQERLPENPRAWLVQVVRHLAINSLRLEGRRSAREERYATHGLNRTSQSKLEPTYSDDPAEMSTSKSSKVLQQELMKEMRL
jgi:DNA-directed RNA polymerase specialized sigma24 family protein